MLKIPYGKTSLAFEEGGAAVLRPWFVPEQRPAVEPVLPAREHEVGAGVPDQAQRAAAEKFFQPSRLSRNV